MLVDQNSQNVTSHESLHIFTMSRSKGGVTTLAPDSNSDIIPAAVIELLYTVIAIAAHGMASFLGLGANCINLIVLSKLGLQNGNSVGVFALSVTDFIVTLTQLATSLCYLLDKMYPDHPSNLRVLGNFELGWIRYTCFFISGWITALLSVERCCCVLLPFKVKQLFSRSRVVTAVLVVYTVYIGFTLPLYASQNLSWSPINFTDNKNVTKERLFLVFKYTEEFLVLQKYLMSVFVVALFFMCQVLLLSCTAVMIHVLHASSKFRHAIKKESHPSVPQYSLSTRERRLVRVILCLALIFTICNLPRFADHALRYAITGMEFGMFVNLSSLLWSVSDFCGTINCSTSFLVYWTLNTNFRKSCLEMFTLIEIYKH
ncbi:FMRFamide receptor [Biomphalaria glabrata]|nr:FMRFamide receptor-like [Biomphalaria glabrata]